MNFDLDVPSSSSSSASSTDSPSETGSTSHLDLGGGREESVKCRPRDTVTDSGIVDELRSALHLSVGQICRAEEQQEEVEQSGIAGLSQGNGLTTKTKMSKEAIAALTDLTYHYATTLLASDLVAFSNHANRKTVKPEDVLLMARKDQREGGILEELTRKLNLSENANLGGNSGKDNTLKNAGVANVRKARDSSKNKKMTGTKSNRKKNSSSTLSPRSSSRRTRSKSSKSKPARLSEMGLSSDSSSSIGSESSDSDDEPIATAGRRRLDQKKSKEVGCKKGNISKPSKEGDHDLDIGSSSSSSELEFNIGASKSPKRQSSKTDRNGAINTRHSSSSSSSSELEFDFGRSKIAGGKSSGRDKKQAAKSNKSIDQKGRLRKQAGTKSKGSKTHGDLIDTDTDDSGSFLLKDKSKKSVEVEDMVIDLADDDDEEDEII